MKKETIEEIIVNASLLEFPIKEWYRSDDYNREEITAARDGFKRGVQWEKDRNCNHNYILTTEDGHRVIKCQKCDNVQPI